MTDSSKQPRRDGDLSNEQVALLVEQFTGQTNRIAEITAMLIKYAQAGGKDWETFERLLDHLAREGMKLIQYGRGPLQPDLEKAARVQIEQAAGTTARQGGMREHLHQRTAASLLATVWFAGQHHLVEADDWPDTLPATVLGAIRQAPAINDDPTMRNLRDTGDPTR
ncbi:MULTISPECIES: hypothetical protein [unclassified Streptomyces]|uniref:hypothetical protein n=1 Tax=unclassified Streptomyces TaxID=2593676 RepID=UPI00226DB731|nr:MULTISPECIES: hypothetical protein [unclassified Streptomyces]MCY0923559.1 hypothetical protein [Streptomyces sp. H27-G5]MCY0962671.1 hypothetical protein [Streptomyces sp. H27-H5]